MIKAGITGGIGSGKTTVCRIFEILGVPVYYADDKAKNILDSNSEVLNKVVEIFGSAILEDKKRIDRKKLAEIVFNDKEKLDLLNKIVHPAVARDFEDWCDEKRNYPYVLKEAAILFESGSYKSIDRIITVTAPVELRIQRVINRDSISREEVTSRMSRQMSDEEKISLSSFVIINDEQQLVIPQVLEIHAQLK